MMSQNFKKKIGIIYGSRSLLTGLGARAALLHIILTILFGYGTYVECETNYPRILYRILNENRYLRNRRSAVHAD